MSLIHELINKVDDITQQEDLLERLDLVQHKIKFMDSVPVCVLDAKGDVNVTLTEFIMAAGGQFAYDAASAVYIIYFEQGKELPELMANVPVTLQADWKAVELNRICLVADDYRLDRAEDAVSLVEDIAEMLHPGAFIFGFEGDKWIRFSA